MIDNMNIKRKDETNLLHTQEFKLRIPLATQL